jgi:hypothetical protein
MQELYNAVIEAKKATKRQARKKTKTKSKTNLYKTKGKKGILKKEVKMNLGARLEIVL